MEHKRGKSILCKGMRKSFSYAPRLRYQKRETVPEIYSLLAYGRCNLSCSFCFAGGGEASDAGTLPDAKPYTITEIEEFVVGESKAGRAIRFSGGEPTLFTDITIHLIGLVHHHNGFAIVDTNGTLPYEVMRLAEHADILSVDALKADIQYVESITHRSKKLVWNNPLETIEMLKTAPCDIEYKTVVFGHTDYKFIEFIYSVLPAKATWTLKQYLSTKSYFPRDTESPLRREKQENLLIAPDREAMVSMGESLVMKHSDLKGRLCVVVDSARNPKNYINF